MKFFGKLVVLCLCLLTPLFCRTISDNRTVELSQAHLHKILENKQEVTFTVTLIGEKDLKLQQIPEPGKYLLKNKEDMFLHEGKLVLVGQNWIAVEN